IIMKQLTEKGYTPLFLTALQAFAGSLFYFPLLLLPSTVIPTTVEPVSAIAVVYLGCVVTFGAYGCFNFGLSRIPATQASAYVNLIPVFALVMGVVVLKESLTFQQYTACGVVFTGLFLSQQKERKPVKA
ncbi:MAG: DMT family transporter, partial [Thermodesulfobacteriota bacterium]|nr:DMT family transporter [Thermodesulfobacteriota bacterium]